MVLPALGTAVGIAGTLAPLLSRRFRSSKGAGLAAGRHMANRAARETAALAKSSPSNASLAMRNAMLSSERLQGDIAGRAAAIEAQQAQRNAERKTNFDNQTGALIGAGLGALGGGLTSFGGAEKTVPSKEAVGGTVSPLSSPAKAPMGNQAQTFSQTMANPPASIEEQNRRRAAGMSLSPFSYMPQSFTSDERIKSQIRDAGYEVDEFLNALRDRRFTIAGREQTGVTAQDLERSEMGREMVSRRPGGVREVDAGQALQGTMAATGRLNERQQGVESRLNELERRNQMLLRNLRARTRPPEEPDLDPDASVQSFPVTPARLLSENGPRIRREFQALPPMLQKDIINGRVTREMLPALEESAPNIYRRFGQQLRGELPAMTPRERYRQQQEQARPRIRARRR